MITFIVLTDGDVLLTTEKGSTIGTFDGTGQQVNIKKYTKHHRVITIFNDGSAWYYLSDNEG